jgi:hypothetical protein
MEGLLENDQVRLVGWRCLGMELNYRKENRIRKSSSIRIQAAAELLGGI